MYPDSVKNFATSVAVAPEVRKSLAELCRICGSFLTVNLKRTFIEACRS
jgi:hypothetical protein